MYFFFPRETRDIYFKWKFTFEFILFFFFFFFSILQRDIVMVSACTGSVNWLFLCNDSDLTSSLVKAQRSLFRESLLDPGYERVNVCTTCRHIDVYIRVFVRVSVGGRYVSHVAGFCVKERLSRVSATRWHVVKMFCIKLPEMTCFQHYSEE